MQRIRFAAVFFMLTLIVASLLGLNAAAALGGMPALWG